MALAEARGRPRSCNFCRTSAWILMETTLSSALAIPTVLLIAGVRLASGITCPSVDKACNARQPHSGTPTQFVWGGANCTTDTTGSTTRFPCSSHSWCAASPDSGILRAPASPLGASRHLRGHEELKMAQSHNMGRSVPPVRTAVLRGLSNNSTPCSSEVQQ